MSAPPKKDWLAAISLVRPLNLSFIALAQYLLLYHLLFPALRSAGAPILLSDWRGIFFLVVTVLLTGAGYAINDMLDVETDQINKPEKWFVGNRIGTKTATVLIWALLLSGGLLSAWIAIDIGKPAYWFIFPAAVLTLWLYSRYLKGVPLAGNLIVAMLCSLVGGILWFAEREGIYYLRAAGLSEAVRITNGMGFYLFFAFLATLFREIVKDCQDVEGDSAANHRTLPVRSGLQTAARLAFVTGLALNLALVYLAWYFFGMGDLAGMSYSLTLLVLPLSIGLFFLSKAKVPNQFQMISRIAKWVIFAGVFLVLFF